MSRRFVTTRICAIVLAGAALLSSGQGCPSAGSGLYPAPGDTIDGPEMVATITGPAFVLVGQESRYTEKTPANLSVIWYGWSLDGAAAEVRDVNGDAEVKGKSVGTAILSLHVADPRYYPALDVWGRKTLQVITATISGPTTLPRGGQGTYTVSIQGGDVADMVFEWRGDFQNTIVTSQSGTQATVKVTNSQFNDIFGNQSAVFVAIKDASNDLVVGGVSLPITITPAQ
jgi:hypothetical protein